MRNKRVLVTGGAGFIGSNLVQELASDNDVLVIDNFSTGLIKNLEGLDEKRVKVLPISTGDVFKTGDEFDYIFHLGMPSSTMMFRKNPVLVAQVTREIVKLLDFCLKSDATLIFASSSSVYNGLPPYHRESMSPKVKDLYSESKIIIERLSELYSSLYGLNAAALRLFSVYGYNDQGKGKYANMVTQMMLDVMNGKSPIFYGDGKQRRDFIFVTDVVDALVRASNVKGFGIYNIGTGINFSFNGVLRLINRMIGTKVKPHYVPVPFKNYVTVTLADTTKAKKELNFKASVDLGKGLNLEYHSIKNVNYKLNL